MLWGILRGIVQIGLKVWNLVHWQIFICSIQICREPKPILNGATILHDSKWPLVKNRYFHYVSKKCWTITNKTTFHGFLASMNLNLVSGLQWCGQEYSYSQIQYGPQWKSKILKTCCHNTCYNITGERSTWVQSHRCCTFRPESVLGSAWWGPRHCCYPQST